MNKLTGFSIIAACSLGLALGGCAGLLTSDRPARTTWWLEPLAPASSTTAFPGGPDLLLEVSVVPGLDTDRILTLSPDAQLSHLAGARWADNLPDVLESVLWRSFQATGGDASVSAEGAGHGESCQIRLEFSQFFALLDQQGDVESTRIAFAAHMYCGGHGWSSSGYQALAAHADTKESIVAALQQGLNTITRSLRAELYNLANANAGSE